MNIETTKELIKDLKIADCVGYRNSLACVLQCTQCSSGCATNSCSQSCMNGCSFCYDKEAFA